MEVEQAKRPGCEELMRIPKVQFVIRGLRLREMESNYRRKEDEIKKLQDKVTSKKEK